MNIDFAWGFSDTEGAALDAAGPVGGRIDDPITGSALRAGALPTTPPNAEAAGRIVSVAGLDGAVETVRATVAHDQTRGS